MEFKNDFEATALYEQRFWLQVLGDHARFIYNALAPSEGIEIEHARCFIHTFDSLLETARGDLDLPAIMMLNHSSYQKAQELRAFKLHLLQRHLTGKISINLPPTFLNHMVNEVEEALSVMGFLVRQELPSAPSPLHLHLVWLQDAFGHAGAIQDGLDLTENKRKEMSSHFAHQFRDFYLKAVEFAQYLRTNVHQFPALSRLNKEAELEMTLFLEFLRELEEQRLTLETLGAFAPLLADHMVREELYYLTKLSQIAETKKPSGDPLAPRIED
ncbi:DUF2935 domain-containing protein [Paenibacillus sedimenti]|uniref:DUF2935 domain-containing protein n=1 Tax=Paenibacillus sedimenti TaxID=2770274 RepID=A0A926KNV1_9BACL|nr:DUF2935 domain-containing protein [Paenibacillus sedimenti]MBD0381165.1 DUF2935 domain-containing protein [Paenibacillus sedimenti]